MRRRIWTTLAAVIAVYLAFAYVLMPALVRQDVERHPALDGLDNITLTGNGAPGDPLNVGLIGSEASLVAAMLAAHWHPADPITLESSLRIAADTVMRRTYDDAPVSDLFVFGRKQDLAFEQPVGPDPKERHHVRFWRSEKLDGAGRPLWIGSATFDVRVGLSYETGQITHHIGPNVDAERDRLLEGLQAISRVGQVLWVDDFRKTHEGINGGGDPYRTDGRLGVGELTNPH